jgi:transposase, IS6 family
MQHDPAGALPAIGGLSMRRMPRWPDDGSICTGRSTSAEKRDLEATRRFFTQALGHSSRPIEVNTNRAPTYPRVLDELLPSACHVTEQYANNAIEADHGRLKSRLRPMRGLKQLRCAQVISTGHAFVQNIRRGHYELGTEEVVKLRVRAAFDELA